MSTIKKRPNRDALDDAVVIFMDAMRPFIVRNMRLVHGGRVEDTIRSSLDDEAQERFRQLLREGEGVEGAIDIGDISRVISRRWREVFNVAFGGDRTVQNTLRRIVKARNRTAHFRQRDIDSKYVRDSLHDIADMLGRIDAPAEKLAVEKIRNALSRRAEDSTKKPEAPNTPPPTPSADQSSYWLNTSNTPALLHKGDCIYVKKYAELYPGHWTEYPTKDAADAAGRSTLRRTRECKDCF